MGALSTLLNWLNPVLHPLMEFRGQVAKLGDIHQSSVQTFGGLASGLVETQAGPEAFTGNLSDAFWTEVQTYLNTENALTGVGAVEAGVAEETAVACEACATEVTGAVEVAAAEVADDAVLDEVTGIVDAAAVAEAGANPIADVAAVILTIVAGAALIATLITLAWSVYNAVQQWQRMMHSIGNTPLPKLPPNPTPIAGPTPSLPPINTQQLTKEQRQLLREVQNELSKEQVNGISDADIENLVRLGYDKQTIIKILLAGISTTLTKSEIDSQLTDLDSRINEYQEDFTLKEKNIAYILSKEGKFVVSLSQQGGNGRKGDALVDGVLTEFKTPDPGADSDTIRNEIQRSIRRGGQARNFILDARSSGLTETEALRALNRMKNLSRGKIDSIRIIGNGYDITSTDFN